MKKDKELNLVKNMKKPLVWKEKEKEKKNKNTRTEPSEEKKKKMVQSCGFDWQWVPPCSVIYRNAIELWVMEITHNSKIRELSDGKELWK